MTDAYFLIVAERQALPGAGFEALLLHDEIVGVLIEDRAETRIHALGFLERLMIFELDRLGRHRPHAVLRDRPQEQDLVQALAMIVRVGPEAVQIGRASCRERVWQYVEISVGAGTFKKKK